MIVFRCAASDDQEDTHAMSSDSEGKVHVLDDDGTQTLCGRDLDGLTRGRVVQGTYSGHGVACGTCDQMQD